MKVKTKAGSFVLANDGKVKRVTEDTTGSGGNLIHGLGKDGDHDEIIAAYDKLAGHITGKEGATVKTGCFYDFAGKKAHDSPKVIYTFRVPGKGNVEVAAEKDLPLEVQAVHQVAVGEKKKRAKTTKKK